MDAKTEIREFLTSRRARITPDQVGLPTYGDNRRVPGLRGEEVALLAGVSVDYYTRLDAATPAASPTACSTPSPGRSSSTTPTSHLIDLARPPNPPPPPAGAGPPSSRSAPACSASSTPSPRRRRSSATGDWTSSPPTSSATRSTPPTSLPAAPRTQPASCSWTPLRRLLRRLGPRRQRGRRDPPLRSRARPIRP